MFKTVLILFTKCFKIFLVLSLVRKMKSQTQEAIELRRPDLILALNQMGDFFMELKWDFQSWGKFFNYY